MIKEKKYFEGIKVDIDWPPGAKQIQNYLEKTTLRPFTPSFPKPLFDMQTTTNFTKLIEFQAGYSEAFSALDDLKRTTAKIMQRHLSTTMETMEYQNNVASQIAESVLGYTSTATLATMSNIQESFNSINQASLIRFSSAIEQMRIHLSDITVIRPFDFTIDSDDTVLPEIPMEEVLDKVKERAKIERSMFGIDVPYNVVSSEYFLNVYYPTMEIMDFLVRHNVVDPGTIIIIYLLISINIGVYRLVEKKEEEEFRINWPDGEDIE